LGVSFQMKYLEDTNVILNIKLLKEDNGGFTIMQSHYEEKVLSSFGFSDRLQSFSYTLWS
jgi:hypothetical protein